MINIVGKKVKPDSADKQKLNVIDASGRIEKNVGTSGEEKKPFFSLSVFGWIFLVIDVLSGATLLLSLISIIKNKRKQKK